MAKKISQREKPAYPRDKITAEKYNSIRLVNYEYQQYFSDFPATLKIFHMDAAIRWLKTAERIDQKKSLGRISMQKIVNEIFAEADQLGRLIDLALAGFGGTLSAFEQFQIELDNFFPDIPNRNNGFTLSPDAQNIIPTDNFQYQIPTENESDCIIKNGGILSLYSAALYMGKSNIDLFGHLIMALNQLMVQKVVPIQTLYQLSLTSLQPKNLSHQESMSQFLSMSQQYLQDGVFFDWDNATIDSFEGDQEIPGHLPGTSDLIPFPLVPPGGPGICLDCFSMIQNAVKEIASKLVEHYFHLSQTKAMEITSLDPSKACEGETINIHGKNFGSNPPYEPIVRFTGEDGGCIPAEIVEWKDTTIKVIVPDGAIGGCVGFAPDPTQIGDIGNLIVECGEDLADYPQIQSKVIGVFHDPPPCTIPCNPDGSNYFEGSHPHIKYFHANGKGHPARLQLSLGDPIKLSWEISGADTMMLYLDGKNIYEDTSPNKSFSYVMRLDRVDPKFKIVASGCDQTVESTIRIIVDNYQWHPPTKYVSQKIKFFERECHDKSGNPKKVKQFWETNQEAYHLPLRSDHFQYFIPSLCLDYNVLPVISAATKGNISSEQDSFELHLPTVYLPTRGSNNFHNWENYTVPYDRFLEQTDGQAILDLIRANSGILPARFSTTLSEKQASWIKGLKKFSSNSLGPKTPILADPMSERNPESYRMNWLFCTMYTPKNWKTKSNWENSPYSTALLNEKEENARYLGIECEHELFAVGPAWVPHFQFGNDLPIEIIDSEVAPTPIAAAINPESDLPVVVYCAWATEASPGSIAGGDQNILEIKYAELLSSGQWKIETVHWFGYVLWMSLQFVAGVPTIAAEFYKESYSPGEIILFQRDLSRGNWKSIPHSTSMHTGIGQGYQPEITDQPSSRLLFAHSNPSSGNSIRQYDVANGSLMLNNAKFPISLPFPGRPPYFTVNGEKEINFFEHGLGSPTVGNILSDDPPEGLEELWDIGQNLSPSQSAIDYMGNQHVVAANRGSAMIVPEILYFSERKGIALQPLGININQGVYQSATLPFTSFKNLFMNSRSRIEIGKPAGLLDEIAGISSPAPQLISALIHDKVRIVFQGNTTTIEIVNQAGGGATEPDSLSLIIDDNRVELQSEPPEFAADLLNINGGQIDLSTIHPYFDDIPSLNEITSKYLALYKDVKWQYGVKVKSIDVEEISFELGEASLEYYSPSDSYQGAARFTIEISSIFSQGSGRLHRPRIPDSNFTFTQQSREKSYLYFDYSPWHQQYFVSMSSKISDKPSNFDRYVDIDNGFDINQKDFQDGFLRPSTFLAPLSAIIEPYLANHLNTLLFSPGRSTALFNLKEEFVESIWLTHSPGLGAHFFGLFRPGCTLGCVEKDIDCGEER